MSPETSKRIGMIIHLHPLEGNLVTPWPIAVDPEGDVQSGLGDDDGARIIGFGPAGEQRIEVTWQVACLAPDSVVGMSASFSDGEHFFVWKPTVARIEIKEL
jgi:hypothetical protein